MRKNNLLLTPITTFPPTRIYLSRIFVFSSSISYHIKYIAYEYHTSLKEYSRAF